MFVFAGLEVINDFQSLHEGCYVDSNDSMF
jgi:hypothetical protein